MQSDNEKKQLRPPSVPDPETERRKRDMNRSDKEKFQLFAQMLRMNAIYKKAKITHK
jgi:hypothetical protein